MKKTPTLFPLSYTKSYFILIILGVAETGLLLNQSRVLDQDQNPQAEKRILTRRKILPAHKKNHKQMTKLKIKLKRQEKGQLLDQGLDLDQKKRKEKGLDLDQRKR